MSRLLPPLGVRQRGARPRAAPGGPLAARRARSRSPPADVRRLARASASPPRSSRCAAASTPTRRCASSSTRPPRGTSPDRRAGRDGRGGLGGLQGHVQGHARGPGARSRPLRRASSRPSRTRGSRTRRSTPEIDELLEPHRDRITWDAPIHSIADIEALPFAPRMVNLKPSRLGGLRSLLRRLRLLRRARHRRLRRRPVRARPGAGPHPVPGVAVPCRHAQRRGAGRLQRPRAAAGPAGQPAAPHAEPDRLSLGLAAPSGRGRRFQQRSSRRWKPGPVATATGCVIAGQACSRATGCDRAPYGHAVATSWGPNPSPSMPAVFQA